MYREEDDGAPDWRGNPSKYHWAICDRCSGEGKHVNPNVDGHGLSREDFDEDPDFEEAYFAGLYDVSCSECGGAGKVKLPNPGMLSFSERRALVEARRRAQWRAQWRAESTAEQRRESMMLGEF